MRGAIGCPARTITHIPHRRYLANHAEQELTEKAKWRLKIIDFYHQHSARFSSREKVRELRKANPACSGRNASCLSAKQGSRCECGDPGTFDSPGKILFPGRCIQTEEETEKRP